MLDCVNRSSMSNQFPNDKNIFLLIDVSAIYNYLTVIYDVSITEMQSSIKKLKYQIILW